MRVPSGDHLGEWASPRRRVNCVEFAPVLSDIQISRLPVRSEEKTSLVPSWERCGCPSFRVDATTLVGAAPGEARSNLQMLESRFRCA